MATHHFNPATNKVGVCRAKSPSTCPLSKNFPEEKNLHFNSQEEAEDFMVQYTAKQQESMGNSEVNVVKKSKKKEPKVSVSALNKEVKTTTDESVMLDGIKHGSVVTARNLSQNPNATPRVLFAARDKIEAEFWKDPKSASNSSNREAIARVMANKNFPVSRFRNYKDLDTALRHAHRTMGKKAGVNTYSSMYEMQKGIGSDDNVSDVQLQAMTESNRNTVRMIQYALENKNNKITEQGVIRAVVENPLHVMPEAVSYERLSPKSIRNEHIVSWTNLSRMTSQDVEKIKNPDILDALADRAVKHEFHNPGQITAHDGVGNSISTGVARNPHTRDNTLRTLADKGLGLTHIALNPSTSKETKAHIRNKYPEYFG